MNSNNSNLFKIPGYLDDNEGGNIFQDADKNMQRKKFPEASYRQQPSNLIRGFSNTNNKNPLMNNTN